MEFLKTSKFSVWHSKQLMSGRTDAKDVATPEVDSKEMAEKLKRWYTPVDNALIDYGALSRNLPFDAACKPQTFYLTTAIAYTNGYPHIGHAYEFMSSDIIVRFHRLLGYDTFFLTGSDEHGQKVWRIEVLR
jgi:methionyl-tRNA synthetase